MNIETNANGLAPTPSPIVDFWNAILAPKFIRYKHILVDGLARHSEAIIDHLPVRPGDHAIDVGCGFGDTALQLSKLVGPSGSVLGIDCCEAFLEIARADAKDHSPANVHFIQGDVERGIDAGVYDFVFARFGTMFFTNPVAGLRAMKNCLVPGKSMAHIVWRHREDNPWLSAAKGIVADILPPPGENALNCGPGPFSMADQETTTLQMKAAGLEDIEFKRIDAKVLVGQSVEDAIAFQLALGPAGEIFREAGPLAEERRPEIEAALAELFSDVERDDQGLWMDSSSWLITARSPAAG